MNTIISHAATAKSKTDIVLLIDSKNKADKLGLTKEEQTYFKEQTGKNEKKLVGFNRFGYWLYVQVIENKDADYQTAEACRKAAFKLCKALNDLKLKEVTILDVDGHANETLAFAEGIALSNYQFLKYKGKLKYSTNTLHKVNVVSKKINQSDCNELTNVVKATMEARKLVDEPVQFLNATQLSKEIEKLGKEHGFKVEVLNKSKITALKMGGLLGVNQGSVDPCTFTILEYKSAKAKNKKPYVLVGKGVTYDTGGMNLKLGTNMETMKCDMAGAAAVAGTLSAIAANKLPVHVIGLIPATDNRVTGNAIVPGDILTLHNGKTVEMLNSDAEGRLILGDALSYAQKYKPELVIDLATLTGAAVAAIGTFGTVMMGTANDQTKSKLKKSGEKVYERLAEFPFWEEYDELIKSDIADIKNIGGPYGGSITAGKFLWHFTDYPWIHLDIAGPSFLGTVDTYRGKGATGVGVRLLYDFFKNC